MSILFPICMLQSSVVPYKYRPTTFSVAISGTGAGHSNDANAYDIVPGYELTTDTTTAASSSVYKETTDRGTTGAIVITYSGFSGIYSYTPGQVYALYLRLNAISDTMTSGDSTTTSNSSITIGYSLDGGSTWGSVAQYARGLTSGGIIQISVSIGSSVTYSQLQVRVSLYGEAVWNGVNLSSISFASASLDLYDIMLY